MEATFLKAKKLTKAEIEEHKSESNGNPSIYVGTYYKYNCGSIFGMWLDLTTFGDADELEEFCRSLHRDEEDPEFMVQDFECFPRDWYCESGLPDDDLLERIKDFADLDEDQQKAFEEYINDGHEDANWSDFEEKIIGRADSWSEFAQDYISECYPDLEDKMPNFIYNAIDWEHVGQELSYDFTMYGDYIIADY